MKRTLMLVVCMLGGAGAFAGDVDEEIRSTLSSLGLADCALDALSGSNPKGNAWLDYQRMRKKVEATESAWKKENLLWSAARHSSALGGPVGASSQDIAVLEKNVASYHEELGEFRFQLENAKQRALGAEALTLVEGGLRANIQPGDLQCGASPR